MTRTRWMGLFGLSALASAVAAADLTLYAEGDFQGRPVAVVIDLRQLDTLLFNDRASSVVIEKGAWVLCTGEDFSGDCVTLEPGRYGSLKELGLDDSVTSVKRRDATSPGIFSDAPLSPGEN
jgi:Beta/Gamma crystallin